MNHHAAVEALIATTEVGILRVFPGNDDLVAAILSPHEERPRKARKAPGG